MLLGSMISIFQMHFKTLVKLICPNEVSKTEQVVFPYHFVPIFKIFFGRNYDNIIFGTLTKDFHYFCIPKSHVSLSLAFCKMCYWKHVIDRWNKRYGQRHKETHYTHANMHTYVPGLEMKCEELCSCDLAWNENICILKHSVEFNFEKYKLAWNRAGQ